ncbi:hypothetical protein [Ramlibacter sp. AN1133]|uniref:hypothetical protein n=1 Tax=Ramlibacter sp. AN1133 TaxID=3133429 RepID=UPI0030C3CA2F
MATTVYHGAPVASDPNQGVTVRVGDGTNRSHTVAIDALQDQSVAVRLSDIKEEARARRQHEQRFSSAPGDSR